MTDRDGISVSVRPPNAEPTPTSLPPTSSRPQVLDNKKVKVVLLEGIHPVAVEMMKDRGFNVIEYNRALTGDELLDVASDCHVLGIRSKTQLTEDFFDMVGQREHRLWGVGCYCIGTNQVNLDAATARGVPIFNAPFSNTRSVAEKVRALSCSSSHADPHWC